MDRNIRCYYVYADTMYCLQIMRVNHVLTWGVEVVGPTLKQLFIHPDNQSSCPFLLNCQIYTNTDLTLFMHCPGIKFTSHFRFEWHWWVIRQVEDCVVGPLIIKLHKVSPSFVKKTRMYWNVTHGAARRRLACTSLSSTLITTVSCGQIRGQRLHHTQTIFVDDRAILGYCAVLMRLPCLYRLAWMTPLQNTLSILHSVWYTFFKTTSLFYVS